MKKFLVLYKASQAEFEKALSSSPEEQKAGMDEWMKWGKKAEKSIVEMGAPLGKTLLVKRNGASPSRNDLGGYSVLQGESKEAVAKVLEGHPHFLMGDSATIEVVEIMPIPGM
jgi:hypothetical protein